MCPICERFGDTQQHLILCKVLQDIRPMKEQVHYNYIHGTTQEQEDQQSLPGLYNGPQQRQTRTKRTSTCNRNSGIQYKKGAEISQI